jgi:hypothetical protein
MISYIFFPLLFSIAYALKGGQGDDVFRNWHRTKNSHPLFEVLLSAKTSSIVLILIGLSVYSAMFETNLGVGQTALQSVIYITIAWILSIAPSMGEEYGALLGKGYPVDENDKGMTTIRIPLINKKFSWRKEIEYGVKKAIQRGVWSGACLAVVTDSTLYIWYSLLFVPLAALNLHYAPRIILDRWGWSEIAIGAIVYGLPTALIHS